MSQENVELIRNAYEAFARGDVEAGWSGWTPMWTGALLSLRYSAWTQSAAARPWGIPHP